MPGRNVIIVFIVTSVVVTFAVGTNPVGAQCRIRESSQLIGGDISEDDYFGFRVDMSENRVVAGAYRDDDNGPNSGSVYVYRLEDVNWIQEAKLLASDGAEEDWFGWSAAISGDTIVVGANGDMDAGDWTGSVYVFRYDGANWIERAKLLADGTGYYWEEFGFDVAISADANSILVGACKANDNGFKSGAAYVFRFDGFEWIQQAKLLADDGVELATFANSVAISDDGNTALIGAPGKDTTGYTAGSVYVFTFDGQQWSRQQKLVASDASHGDHFGHHVAISGRTAVIGAYGDDNAEPDDLYCNSGSAYVFGFDGKRWIEQAKLWLPEAGCRDQFGWAVDVSGDTIVIGAPDGHWQTADGPGFAYVYGFYGSQWEPKFRLTCSGAAYADHFGWSVAVEDTTVLVGASWDDMNGLDSGAAYIFEPGVCPGDFDSDGDIDFSDLAVFASAWLTGSDDIQWNHDCDIDADGFVGVSDLILFSENWLESSH
jgi:hypothetical protein